MKRSRKALLRGSVLVAVAIAVDGCAPVDRTTLVPEPAPERVSKARVNGVELGYIDRGQGRALVFVHGGLGDYREWDPVAKRLAAERRTIVYSRRYNFPNDNPLAGNSHSAVVEAADLAALIRHLGLQEADIAGVSYGAYTALELALHEPQMVRTLTLVEPPLLRWLPNLPGGRTLFEQFYVRTWQASGQAFARGDTPGALRISMDFFVGPGAFDAMPPQSRSELLANAREWQALTTSTDAFPPITRGEIQSLKIPVLMISGGKTYPMLKLTDDELERALPRRRRQVVAEGTHEVCSEQASVCAEAIHAFLKTLPD